MCKVQYQIFFLGTKFKLVHLPKKYDVIKCQQKIKIMTNLGAQHKRARPYLWYGILQVGVRAVQRACTIFIVSTCKLKKNCRLLIVFVAAVVVLCWLLRVLRGMIAKSPIQESGGFCGRRSDWWRFQRCCRTLSNTFTQLARYQILYQISFYWYRKRLTKSSLARGGSRRVELDLNI